MASIASKDPIVHKGRRRLEPQEFVARVAEVADEAERERAEACAKALAPALTERPVLLRRVLRGDPGIRPVTVDGAWASPDEAIVAAAPLPSGEIAALVSDSPPLVPRKRSPT